MRHSPKWKVYDANNEMQACTKRPEEAAAVVALLGPKATIRLGQDRLLTVWTEGMDGNAYDSYDEVARLCYGREDLLLQRLRGKS